MTTTYSETRLRSEPGLLSEPTLLRPSPGVEGLLAAARARLERLSPHLAFRAQERGALIVDIRPHAQRLREGEVRGALVLERNVLEWRLDPASPDRVVEARADLQVLILCSEGYTSSLAAAALHDVGVPGATDIVGGVAAWREAGLPLVPGGTPAGSRSAGRPTGLLVDPDRWEVTVDGRPVAVTVREFRLLVALVEADGKVLRRAEAAAAADVPADGRNLDVLLCRLRRRLGPQAARLVTIRGVGLRLRSEPPR